MKLNPENEVLMKKNYSSCLCALLCVLCGKNRMVELLFFTTKNTKKFTKKHEGFSEVSVKQQFQRIYIQNSILALKEFVFVVTFIASNKNTFSLFCFLMNFKVSPGMVSFRKLTDNFFG